MKLRHLILLLATLLIPVEIMSQAERYQHPDYEISFEASPNWSASYLENTGGVYELINPNQNMVVRLDFIPDCKRPRKYLKNLSGLKGLASLRGNYDTVLNDHEALILCGNCLEFRESFSTMVIGFPTSDGLYLMEITCPDKCQAFHREKLQSILKTIEIGSGSII